MANKIEINSCEFVPTFKKDKKIKFESTDGSEYRIECGSSDCSFTDDLPLTVPANGSKSLKIKKGANTGTYKLELKCPPFDDNIAGPVMIIKVE